jgi:hypothetical protein
MAKAKLAIDLRATERNMYLVIGKARQIVPSEQLNEFISAYLDAQQPGVNKSYEDMLALVNHYVDLTDTSGLYPQYGVQADG